MIIAWAAIFELQQLVLAVMTHESYMSLSRVCNTCKSYMYVNGIFR